MLAHALREAISQCKSTSISFEVVVVDNDKNCSAEAVIQEFQKNNEIKIIYDCEPKQNIALARNRAILNATGNYIAFIDDDEFPLKDWITPLYKTMIKYRAAGALGPVLPFFPPGAPQWLTKGNIFERKRMQTGTLLTSRNTRTGNVLLDKNTLPKKDLCFDPKFGLGGEDVDFFKRQIEAGYIYVWCDEAEIYETVRPERWKTRFHLKTYLRIGTINGERLRTGGSKCFLLFIKYFTVLPMWFSALIILLPFGKHIWIRPVLKMAYSLGSILAYFKFFHTINRYA